MWHMRHAGSGRPQRSLPALARYRGWKLQDAKARFSDLVRRAREEGPQRVTVYGQDAVVVVSAAEFARMIQPADRPSLYELLSQSPLRDIEFDFEGERSPVREVEL
jgi:antitoxin Phd